MGESLIGFIRAEKKFDSFPQLVEAITNDVENSKLSLDQEPYSSFKLEVPFLSKEPWIGKEGGDEKASWEFEDWDTAIARVQ